MEFAELSGDKAIRAFAYKIYGSMQSLRGNISLGHEYLYKAINLYESLNNYEGVFTCLSGIVQCLTQTRDSAGLRKVIEQMQQYIGEPSFSGNYKCLYDLYSAQYIYYDLLAKENRNTAYNDSALIVSRKIINLIENNRIKPTVSSIAVAYYNMALSYAKCYSNRHDSIYFYLDKALELKTGYQLTDIEMEISVYEFYAELHFEHKKYDRAEKDMLHVLSLLEDRDYYTVIPHYSQVYKFLAMYYEAMNRPDEALKYHKLLLENEKKRYDNDKIVAMDDMLVKYETEKKKEQIDRLTERNKTAKKILILSIGLIIFLLIGLLVLILLHKSRKKNLEHSIYETALLAELKHTELDRNREEKEHLQQQYDNLKTQADRNKQKAQLYDAKLKRIKQQLEQKPTKIMIEKLTDWISKSGMEEAKKNTYIRQLSELDIDALEQGYLTTDEKISNMDMKYIICFASDMDVKDMSILFNVEPASIRSVRYRIKKKFGEKNTFKFLI